MKGKGLFAAAMLSLFVSCSVINPTRYTGVDVLVIGGGASGTMAGIQSARLGANTLIAEETPWLGGMLTSAGVSAIDGNYRLYSGLWEEFRQKLYTHYGGAGSVKTGWVSNVLFEPAAGASILLQMAEAEQKLQISFNCKLRNLRKKGDGWIASFTSDHGRFSVKTILLIDGTELGDVAKMADVPYTIGMDSRDDTGEEIAPELANDIVQDLTYVAILEDFGRDADMTIPRPENYDPAPFRCTCANKNCEAKPPGAVLWDCAHMMEYGHLPGNKFMINWPINGNDYYVNVIEMSAEKRAAAYAQAKWHTRCYIYYLQTELGYKNLGIAKGEFPTDDGFPMFPYHRESRRIRGKVRFTLNDLARPYDQLHALYRTGIAVGDYPVDHHHGAYPDPSKVPDIHFYPVPSFALPLGTLIPAGRENIIVAEKSVSVTNIVNGTTRLQPVCMLTGQAAGVLAALSVQAGVTPADVPVRRVQQTLLNAGAYLMPYADVTPEDCYWDAVQCIGATGIIKGEGKNQGWTNLTLFYPDSLMTSSALTDGLKELIPGFKFDFMGPFVTLEEAGMIAMETAVLTGSWKKADPQLLQRKIEEIRGKYAFGNLPVNTPVSRSQMAAILHEIANPFSLDVDLNGTFKKIPADQFQ